MVCLKNYKNIIGKCFCNIIYLFVSDGVLDIWASTEITDYATMTGNNLYLFSVTFQVTQVGYVQDCIQVWTKSMADLFLVDYPDSDFPGNKPHRLLLLKLCRLKIQ